MKFTVRRTRATEYVSRALAPDEHITAIVPASQTLLNYWFLLPLILGLLILDFVVLVGTALILGSIVVMATNKYFGIVVTTKRVFVIRWSFFAQKPTGLAAEMPISRVRVTRWAPGGLWCRLDLTLGDTPMKLYVRRDVVPDVNNMLATLGAATPSA